MSEQARRDLMVRQAELTALSKHSAWPVLEAVLDDRQARLERLLVGRLLSPNPLTQERVDMMRGFIAGMRYALAVPNGAETRLAAFLKEQGLDLEKEERAA